VASLHQALAKRCVILSHSGRQGQPQDSTVRLTIHVQYKNISLSLSLPMDSIPMKARRKEREGKRARALLSSFSLALPRSPIISMMRSPSPLSPPPPSLLSADPFLSKVIKQPTTLSFPLSPLPLSSLSHCVSNPLSSLLLASLFSPRPFSTPGSERRDFSFRKKENCEAKWQIFVLSCLDGHSCLPNYFQTLYSYL